MVVALTRKLLIALWRMVIELVAGACNQFYLRFAARGFTPLKKRAF
jgi:hypothetical protein